jgi:hypothetical protein
MFVWPALALVQLGLSMAETDAPRARSLLEESLSLSEASGDDLLTAQALQRLGLPELIQSNVDRVGDRLVRALAIHRRLNDWHEVALTLRWHVWCVLRPDTAEVVDLQIRRIPEGRVHEGAGPVDQLD